MSKSNKFKSAILVLIIVTVAAIILFMWHTNRGPFQGQSVAGLPDGHITSDDFKLSHFDLLFRRRGSVSFNHFGENISVFLAYYQYDSLVLHETITRLSTIGDTSLSGHMFWGVTSENEIQPNELRVRIFAGPAETVGYFDFSQFDFGVSAILGQDIPRGPIVRGKRYPLQVWQSGGTVPVAGTPFDADILNLSGHTVILYIIFD